MSDRPADFDDDDIDMGEPITDKLNVLLEELSDEWRREDGEVDLGEPVTDKLHVLLAALPEDWQSKDDGIDMVEPVTDRLTEIFDGAAGEAGSTEAASPAGSGRPPATPSAAEPRGFMAFVKRLFGG